MKHLRIYEGYYKKKYSRKYKRFIVSDFTGMRLDEPSIVADYFLDEILEFKEKEVKISTLYTYDINQDILENEYFDDYIPYSFLEQVVFSSDNIEEARKYFDDIVNMYRDTKKYNI